MVATTIQLDKKVVDEIKNAKEYPEQSYNSLIEKMIENFKSTKKRNQYNKFIHEAQKRKMKELWGGKEDEAWEHV